MQRCIHEFFDILKHVLNAFLKSGFISPWVLDVATLPHIYIFRLPFIRIFCVGPLRIRVRWNIYGGIVGIQILRKIEVLG